MTIDMNKDLAVSFAEVSKVYHTYSTPQHRLFEILSGGRKRYAYETRALDSVSFSLKKGGRLGIIGENGSGKSTLLKVLAGVLTPSSGVVQVNGRISALLELGAGFNPELPGAENIRQFCMLHGMHSDETDEAVPDIVKFSELREAINHPVKTYSSGMAVRLGFACAVYVKPEILIVDEALSVGDAYFQNKCLHKIKSLLDEGATFIYVTHAADAIRSLCNQGIWMERGRVRQFGTSSEVGAVYQAEVFRRMVGAGLSNQTEAPEVDAMLTTKNAPKLSIDHACHKAFEERVASLRTGSGAARIQYIALVDVNGVDTDSIEFNAKFRVKVFYRVECAIPEGCALTLGVTDSSGRQVLHFNSALRGVFISPDGMHTHRVIEFEFANQLCPGEYGLIAGIGLLSKNPETKGQSLIEELCDYCVGGARFSVRFPNGDSDHDLWGLVHVPYSVSECVLD
jgi:lipopolysaccharide transport system ATP-binding protein